MQSLLDRYMAGMHHAVWDRIRETDGDALDGELAADAAAVAAEMMRRVARNATHLVEGLRRAAWRFAHQDFVRSDPPADVDDTLRQVGERLGAVPLALDACLRYVGDVDLCGSHRSLDPPLYGFHGDPSPFRWPWRKPFPTGHPLMADPLVIPSARWLLDDLTEWDTDDWVEDKRPYLFVFAPDELHKGNISGSTHNVYLPDASPDPVLEGVEHRSGITLVEYLRFSFAWCGFPGYEFLDEPLPTFIEELRPGLVEF